MPKQLSFAKFFDSISKLMNAEVEEGQHESPAHKREHQKEIENAVLVLAAAVIRCDRNYTSNTEKYVHQFINRQFGGRGVAQRIKSIERYIKTGAEPFIKIACRELNLLTTYESRTAVIGFLLGVADVDDFINAKELRCIKRIAAYLLISDADFIKLKSLFTYHNSPYKLLGVEETATLVQVKAAYRKMALKYHPDKRESNLSEEDANEKFREIQRAFEHIKKLNPG